MSLVEIMYKEHIFDYPKQNPDFDNINDKIKIKINGDGFKMTRNSNFILLSFSILQTGESVMSAKGNRNIGIVRGTEEYYTIKGSTKLTVDTCIQTLLKLPNHSLCLRLKIKLP